MVLKINSCGTTWAYRQK